MKHNPLTEQRDHCTHMTGVFVRRSCSYVRLGYISLHSFYFVITTRLYVSGLTKSAISAKCDSRYRAGIGLKQFFRFLVSWCEGRTRKYDPKAHENIPHIAYLTKDKSPVSEG